MSETTETRSTPENGEVREAITPEVARVLAGIVDKKYFKPGETLPQDKANEFKTELGKKTEDSINYVPLEKQSMDSRLDYYSDEERQKREEREKKEAEANGKVYEEKSDWDTWHDAVAENIAFYASAEHADHEDYIATLKSLGMEIDKDNVDNDLSAKIDKFHKDYFRGKSDIKTFVDKIAQGCKDEAGHTNVNELESRLHAIKGLMTSFGEEKDAIPQLIEAHAKGQAILSQEGEEKQKAIDEAADQMKQSITDATLTEGFTKLAELQPQEPKAEPEPEPKSALQKRYEELTDTNNQSVLKQEQIDEIKKEVSALRTKQSSEGLSEADVQRWNELVAQRDKTRFLTDDLEQVKQFRELQGLPSEGIVTFFDSATKEDREAGKKMLFGFEFYRDENGEIKNRPTYVERTTPEATKPTPAVNAPKDTAKIDGGSDAGTEPEEAPKPTAEREIEDHPLPESKDDDARKVTDETEPAEPQEPAPVGAAPPIKPDAEGKDTKDTQNAVEAGDTLIHNGEKVKVQEVDGDTATVEVTENGPNDGEEREIPIDQLEQARPETKEDNDSKTEGAEGEPDNTSAELTTEEKKELVKLDLRQLAEEQQRKANEQDSDTQSDESTSEPEEIQEKDGVKVHDKYNLKLGGRDVPAEIMGFEGDDAKVELIQGEMRAPMKIPLRRFSDEEYAQKIAESSDEEDK